MKKLWLITLSLIMAFMLCFGLTACSDTTVEQLFNEIGAIIEGGNFKEGSVFNLDKIDITEEKATEILNKLEDNGITIDDETKTHIYDIFVTNGNTEVQPNGSVKVTIPAPEDENAEGYNVYHVKDSGAIESIPTTYQDGKISFETDSFSYYVLVPTYNFVNVSFKGNLYVGSNLFDGITIYSSYEPLTQYSSTISKGIYLLGEETTLDLQINNPNQTFLGWYEAEDFYLDNYEKPVLKDAPVSTETSYTFKTDKNEYAIYAVFAEIGGKIHFNVSNNGGVITMNGEPVEPNYTDDFKVGKSYALTAEAYEGYRFAGWSIYGEMSYSFVEEASFTLVTKADEKTVVAVFEPVVTNLTVDMDDLVYDVTLLEKYESISIPDFNAICQEGSNSENWKTDYVIFGKIKSISNTTWGNMIIVDDEGNELHVFGLYLEDGTRYGKMEIKPEVGDFIAVYGKPYLYGTEPEMQKGYLLNATPILPNFDSVTVHAYTPKGSSVLSKDEYTVDVSMLNTAKPGEYLVIYTYNENPEIKATVSVKVLANAPVDFSAWVNGGTLLLDGVEIGLDYFETFKDGFGKVTLTAVGEENTVFKGWYESGDNSRTPISTDETYTFEFDENTYVYAEYEYVASEIWLDGMNMGFNTNDGITEIWLPLGDVEYDPNSILVFALINGERESLTADEYTIDLDGFDGTNPAKGDYVLTFTYKANPDLKATHIIRVIDEENMVWFEVSCSAGGRVKQDKPYNEFNKGEQVTVTVELRSESDYEFLGWYTVDASGEVSSTCISTDRTYTVTLNETTYLYAKVEPKITRLELEGYEGEPTRIHISKFWLADREIKVYACGALGKRVELTADDYTVDMGGLDLTNPVVGKYIITYTYKADTNITYTIIVWVYDADYTFSATQDSPDNGWLIFEGALTHEVEPYQYVNGEEITITAMAKEGYTFLGWYLEIDKETHCEYELLSTEATYTFTINKDTNIQAKFGAPVTEIDLGGASPITVYRGDFVDLSQIGVWSYSLIESRNLNTDEYTVDLGGLDVNDPIAGTYTITYTYKENPELTATLTVTVLKRSYYVEVTSNSGRFKYNGDETMHLFEKFEEGTTIVLEAVIPNSMVRTFLGWHKFDYATGEWKIYSPNKTLTLVVEEWAEGEIRLRPVYGYVTRNLDMYVMDPDALYEAGVQHWNFDDMGYWDEELGRYIAYGNIDLYADSEYVNDIEGLFANFNIVAVDSNGRHTVINASDLVIDLGEYKAEEGWYKITVSYGSFTMNVDVMVFPS